MPHPVPTASPADRPPRVLLVSAWQTVNIGDVAHTPGALLAFQHFAPGVEVTLLARNLDDREREMITTGLPQVRLIEEAMAEGADPSPDLLKEFERADILVHGSGPAMVARKEVAAWRRLTGKPYGFFGITIDPLQPYLGTLEQTAGMIESIDFALLDEGDRLLLDEAAFVFCRDSQTLRFLESQKIASPLLEFGPDATLIFDLELTQAEQILHAQGIQEDGFLCVVPRLRFTPYYRLRNFEPRAVDLRKEAYNAGFVDTDLAVLRSVIIDWVRSTGRHVLVVPEMSYAVELAQDKLADYPADVAEKVHVLPYFWSLTEASAVYRQAAAVVSMECHSPLIATALNVPAVYIRQPTDTIKGQMYADIGLDDHIFEIAPDPSQAVIEVLRRVVADPSAATTEAGAARLRARDLLERMVQTTLHAAGAP